MLNAHNITVSFAGEDLFSGITFKLVGGDRVGLVGKNGAGKSTLLKIIAKEQEYDKGTLALEKNLRIGFLKQDIDFVFGRTVLEEAYQAFTEIKEVEKKLEEVNVALVERTDYESEGYHQLMVDLSDLTHRFELIGGYNYQGDTEKILQGLGFKREDFDKLTDTFSGGWRMRIELAKLLLQNNDILLLDEPTNHLDIESIIWLEEFLKSYPGAIMLVSHDKMFLDNVTNRTIEISLGKIYDYKYPYSKYLVQRKELKEKQLQTQKNQEKEIQRTEQLIEKFRAKASKATMAQSLIKKLNKVERIEVDAEDNSVMKVRFPMSVQPGKVVVEAKNLAKNYGDNQVLKNVNLLIERNSKIAFVGQNGQGKSTLAKMIVGEIPYDGNLKLGHNVQIGYFAQNQAEYLDGEKTVLQTMEDASNDGNRVKVRDMLGGFLFGGDDVEKKVKVLSGGERNRLALCKMLLSPFNVLVMDEPTNHLDIASKNVLKQALHNFEGTLILVSHDRDFLQGLTKTVYEFKDSRIKEYLGDIDYYLEEHNLENLREVEKRTKVTKVASTPKNDAKNDYEKEKEVKKAQNKLSNIETQIADLEKEVAQIDKKLSDESQYEKVTAKPDFFKNYQAKKDKINTLMQEWENLHEVLEG
ncbi:ABC-F family ATP-binding cassette domain-containing protein [Aureibaculum sp. 2210JD6-5]|uniref:ABC-F family ATP-binding cassette domain-containing protein n=1 Tax=Aureibaculum sp. 2210JD6-5 TaxID=3103957 RepID=UPI002AADC641|nr:ABC-F family ATP-binding cassette domain-containing protein [Aureibaculum sp. 2210JD6-5]MDY7395307.1 ABC-F family ATP-binding cassette domain-containing protein [Aureibaculum sp. 2210JD6-5]